MKPPLREVQHNNLNNCTEILANNTTPVYVTSTEPLNTESEFLFTQEGDPHKPEHVKKIIQEVMIGPDITDEQHQTIHKLLEEYVDCFALSIKEVNAIPGAVHKLKIPEGATFRTKIPPRSYNPNQQAFMNAKVDEMLEARIIRLIHPSEVCFIAQTVLVQKTHEGQGLSIDELKHKVNKFILPPQSEPNPTQMPKQNTPVKWRMCQDFGGINK